MRDKKEKAREATGLVQPQIASRLRAITSSLYPIIFGALRSMLSLFVGLSRCAAGGGAAFLGGVAVSAMERSGLSSLLRPYLARFRDLASWSFFVTCCCH